MPFSIQKWANPNSGLGPLSTGQTILGGGPGIGKSTSAKALAARAALRPDVRPLYIPLQHLSTTGRLRDNINSHFSERSGNPFSVAPLERRLVEQGPRLLLIFDGLDEIARPGESADDISRDMIDWIRDLHGELSGDLRTLHRVLVTGRMPSFQSARKRINRLGKESLEGLGFLPLTREREVRQKASEMEGNADLIAADMRERWWTGYANALGKPKKPPAALKDRDLDGLTGEPLLCYLLALSGYLEGDSAEAADNRNRIYERLLADVWKRGWGGGRAGTGKDLDKNDFDRLFESIALAAWHGGDERVATYERFEKALKVMHATDIFDAFTRREGGDVSNLAVNFYLKRHEVEARGFEFTHKSFGEYLAARALIRISISVSELSTHRIEIALKDWMAAVEEGDLSFEMLEFLRGEARLLPADVAERTLRALENIMRVVVAEGFPAHDLKTDTWREAEDRQKKAEVLLLATMHCLSQSMPESNSASKIAIDWKGDVRALGNLIHRCRCVRNRAIPALSIFARVQAPGAYLLVQDLLDANFEEANLRDAWAFGTVADRALFARADLSGANFTSGRFVFAHLDGARMDRASLTDANFEGAFLRGASLSQANCEGANFSNANLNGASLQKAKLQGANFWGATLDGANLSGADLRGADLTGVNLTNVNLTDAKQGVLPKRERGRVARGQRFRNTSEGVA